MTPPVRHLLSLLAAFASFAAVGLAVVAARTAFSPVPDAVGPEPPVSVSTLPAAPAGDPLAGLADVLAAPPRAVAGALAKRFRLAGIIHGTDGEFAVPPMAVFDDRVAVRQSVVQEGGEVVSGVQVTRIEEDAVVLTGPDGEERLTIEKTGPRATVCPRSKTAVDSEAAPLGVPDSRDAAAARFGGEELFPGRWHFDREKVIAYYDELRSEPERLLSIFDSMDPNYVEDAAGNRSIDGYVVGAEGERDFFLAAGLRDGDIVKSVNKCAMTSRVFAEGLISAFVEGSATMFVLEIERDGKTIEEVVEIE